MPHSLVHQTFAPLPLPAHCHNAHSDSSMAGLQNGWNLLSLLVLFCDLLRLRTWPFYMERAVRMLSSLRALRIVALSPAMQALLGALAKSMKAIAALALLSMPHCPCTSARRGCESICWEPWHR